MFVMHFCIEQRYPQVVTKVPNRRNQHPQFQCYCRGCRMNKTSRSQTSFSNKLGGILLLRSSRRMYSLFLFGIFRFLGFVRGYRIQINCFACKHYLREMCVNSKEIIFLLLKCGQESVAGFRQTLLFPQVFKMKLETNLTITRIGPIQASLCEFTQKLFLLRTVGAVTVPGTCEVRHDTPVLCVTQLEHHIQLL